MKEIVALIVSLAFYAAFLWSGMGAFCTAVFLSNISDGASSSSANEAGTSVAPVGLFFGWMLAEVVRRILPRRSNGEIAMSIPGNISRIYRGFYRWVDSTSAADTDHQMESDDDGIL